MNSIARRTLDQQHPTTLVINASTAITLLNHAAVQGDVELFRQLTMRIVLATPNPFTNGETLGYTSAHQALWSYKLGNLITMTNDQWNEHLVVQMEMLRDGQHSTLVHKVWAAVEIRLIIGQ